MPTLTHSQRIAKLEADNATLKLMLGFKFLGLTSEQLAAELKPANELDGGRYPIYLSDYQLRVAAIDPLFAADGILVQLRQDIERLQSEDSGNLALANQLAAVQTQLKAVEKNLADLTLTISELPPVVIPPPPVPVPSDGGDVAAQLAAYDIHLAPGKLAIGMEPDLESQACFQIGGRVAAEIQGRSNTGKTDSQNPDEVHESTLVIVDNDGGARVRQYQTWWNGMRRNTTNRKASTFALFDSMGDTCVSHVEVGATSDGGQSWYIRTTGKIVEFATYKVGGVIRILKSVAKYGATDQQQL